MYQYPYGNAQQLNLDWILSKLQEFESGSGGGADLEEVANALVSASFDATIPYRKYDYAFYDGKLYRALNDNIGAFNPADWLEVTLGADISVLTRLVNADSALLTTLQNQLQNLGSDEVANESTVTGTTVSDALGNLNGAINPLKAIYQKATWEIGSLSTADGTEASATNQIRSDFIRCDTGTRIVCASGYQFIVCRYDIDTVAFIGSSGSWQSSEYTLTGRNWIRIIARKVDQSTITYASDVSGYIYIGDFEIANNVISGTNTYGSYTKFSDGTMIAWGTTVQTKSFSENFNGMYLLRSDAIPFPEEFYASPFVTAIITDGNAGFLLGITRTKSQITQLQFVRPNSTSSGSIRFDWQAIGRWKA